MSLATKILLALVLGILSGLFFGEPMGVLDPVGYAFVKLLQMTVLPYVVVSLIAGLGHLTYEQAGRLAVRGGVLVLLIWTITFAMVVAMPLTFPSRETASFFSTSLVKPRAELDFIALYIPSNPFQSLANNVVPAVVLFSIAVGIALIGVERKGIFVENLSILADALMRVANFIIRLMPFGVFAIAASAAGTMTVEEFASVQVYLVTFVAFAILMTFWVLPGLVTSLTSLRYRDVVGLTRDALVTAFATGSYFVVLPLLAERSKQLLGHCQLDRQESEPLVDVIIPVSYNFPHAAKVLSLSFLLFAGWFSGATVSVEQYPTLAVSGIISMFAGVNLAVPFLLDLLRIPEDMFHLFIAMSVVNARFGAMLSAMYTLALTLLGTCAMAGILTARWGRLVRYVLVTVALTLVIIAGTRALFASMHDTSYRKDQIIAEMHLLEEPVPATVYDSSADALPAPDPNQPRMEAIRERGTLRVGYIPDRLPFSYFNRTGELVGFDVEMAHTLARSLGVGLEFVPIAPLAGDTKALEQLRNGDLDIWMTGFPITLALSQYVDYSVPYLDMTMAFVVEDHRRDEFIHMSLVENRDDLRIGVGNDPYYLDVVRRMLPQATVVPVRHPREFFEGNVEDLDALIGAAEIGSAWSLLYPNYAVAVPDDRPIEGIPLAYPVAPNHHELLFFVNDWIALKKRDGTIQRLYDYWILGQESEAHEPRWSIIRNVLGWAD